MVERFHLRQEHDGWTVYDIFTAQPVVLSGAIQSGLDAIDAEALALLLNCPAMRPDRSLWQ